MEIYIARTTKNIMTTSKIMMPFVENWLVEKIGKYTYALKVLKGMEWCGQSAYMKVLIPLVNKIADDNNFPLRYEQY